MRRRERGRSGFEIEQPGAQRGQAEEIAAPGQPTQPGQGAMQPLFDECAEANLPGVAVTLQGGGVTRQGQSPRWVLGELGKVGTQLGHGVRQVPAEIPLTRSQAFEQAQQGGAVRQAGAVQAGWRCYLHDHLDPFLLSQQTPFTPGTERLPGCKKAVEADSRRLAGQFQKALAIDGRSSRRGHDLGVQQQGQG